MSFFSPLPCSHFPFDRNGTQSSLELSSCLLTFHGEGIIPNCLTEIFIEYSSAIQAVTNTPKSLESSNKGTEIILDILYAKMDNNDFNKYHNALKSSLRDR